MKNPKTKVSATIAIVGAKPSARAPVKSHPIATGTKIAASVKSKPVVAKVRAVSSAKLKAVATTAKVAASAKSKPIATKAKAGAPIPVKAVPARPKAVAAKAATSSKPKTATTLSKASATAPGSVSITSIGNPFTYFVPATAKSATFKKRRKNGGYKAPQDFLDKNFTKTVKAPFTKARSRRTLDGHCVIFPAEVRIAAIQCGYGPEDFWTPRLAMSAGEGAALKRFLISRLEMVVSCVEDNGKKDWKVSKFYEHLEPSDKQVCSFIFGGIGTFLVAQKWLHVGGDKLKFVLHKSLYTKALVPSIGAKSPDYLVNGKATGWHVFESKGGAKNDRPTRILQGLEQLSQELEIGWTLTSLKPTKSAVCVHTSVDANEVLEVLAVDPPAKRHGAKIKAVKSLLLLEEVCKLLLILDTIDLFCGLTRTSTPMDEMDGAWSFKNSDFLGGVEVGIPNVYLKYEALVRVRVAVYLAADEAHREARTYGKNASDIFYDKLDSLGFNGALSQPYGDWTIEHIAKNLDDWGDNCRTECAKNLKMKELAAQVWWSDSDQSVAKMTAAGFNFTFGGMCIRGRNNPMKRSEVD
ncbi:hypothetical protein GTP46_11470 [Duganella sp. FT135W]|uniref:Uncharacterized protein n=1 Tax=Duganella flavida TaxID=2692175 RepID=A0A6L8K898_9BURK|nr:hypothetical protein [Duganella flavida]MYM23265.1 hypothetical protein [Duganella flavida]